MSAADHAYLDSLESEVAKLRKQISRPARPIKPRRGRAAKHICRVFIPDSHGELIDQAAARAFLNDLRSISPDEIVYLGDHANCSSVFSVHPVNYSEELEEGYDSDMGATNAFMDEVDAAAPDALKRYLEGNHEQHIERMLARLFKKKRDVESILKLIGPEGKLRLKERGYQYYRRGEFHMGLPVNGTIKLGKCYVTHGMFHGRSAAHAHMQRVGGSVIFGHCHTAMIVVSRRVSDGPVVAGCPGTLSKLQFAYHQTTPSENSHGYGLQLVNTSTQTFTYLNVPIVDGVSMLGEVAKVFRAA